MSHVHQSLSDFVQWNLNIHRSRFESRPRHTVYHTGMLVLSDGLGSCIVQLLQTRSSVLAHAGQDHSNGTGSGALGSGFEQMVHCGALMVYWGPLIQIDTILCSVPLQAHVIITWSNQNISRCKSIAMAGLFDV